MSFDDWTALDAYAVGWIVGQYHDVWFVQPPFAVARSLDAADEANQQQYNHIYKCHK